MIRMPAVAGMFYESDEHSLKERIKWCYLHEIGPGEIPGEIGNHRSIKGLISPHAGYPFSGPVAAHSYLELARDGMPETLIILCPNHTGIGSGLSAMTEGSWLTPLGEVEIDEPLAVALVEDYPLLDDDPSAHIKEHSCEVQLPFLQDITPDFKIVPICMMMQDLETSRELGQSIAKISHALGKDVVVIASTDFTHYQPHEVAKAQDAKVLEAISALDEGKMIQVIQDYNVTMCGYGPVTATMVAAKAMGATEAKILKYATSGETGGDYNAVVGYGSAVFR
ncbi:MAG: AmmeMemoRadiSam system protein B [Methanobacterium sp.]|nr:AmmeMemoRadiSam system protein B [Methanobacterium sp.]